MGKRSKEHDGGKDRWAADNDHQAGAVQSGEAGPDELWSVSDLIPLVRLLARQAAREIFLKAANDDRQSSTERPKE